MQRYCMVNQNYRLNNVFRYSSIIDAARQTNVQYSCGIVIPNSIAKHGRRIIQHTTLMYQAA